MRHAADRSIAAAGASGTGLSAAYAYLRSAWRFS